MFRALRLSVVLSCLSIVLPPSEDAVAASLIPQTDGDWWPVAGNPDLGQYTNDKQQPVDFAIWQAADGTWQIWSCIRNTKCGGNTRLFYRWKGKRLTDSNWKPMGIAMEADTALGETKGGLQAPHVFKEKHTYYMVYGDWQRICLATSKDGKSLHPRVERAWAIRPFLRSVREHSRSDGAEAWRFLLLLLHGPQERRGVSVSSFLSHVARSQTVE